MDIYQHFRKEEQPFIDSVLSWIDQVERTYIKKVTDFLDPREQQIVDMLIGTNREDLKLYKYGGNNYTERNRLIIAPMYDEVSDEDFQITLMQASYHDKFVSLSHRDVMGAFLSLGIKRKKLGDIFVEDGLIQIVLADEIASYVLANLTSIKKAKVTFEEKPPLSFVKKESNWTESDQTVSSLRLDTVLKAIYNISRKEAAETITKRLVKVNYKIVDDGKFLLEEGDLLSLRGKGRSKLVRINGRTKKDKYKITTALLK
ncbi:RNA-binding protein [Virgibacillus doumboii]|uniref:YlmH family RNA-binding protein n=1 Tax=Virgibacillus doumboii TaxID=2697503 RepID=UPI0013DFC941|nr:RNA-binding protein [Virgibacillus doumboii]